MVDHRGCSPALSGGRSALAPDAPLQGMQCMQCMWHGCTCPVGLAFNAPQPKGHMHISVCPTDAQPAHLSKS